VSSHRPVTVAFVLVSWALDAPAGMERAVAACAAGLVAAGHHATIVTAADAGITEYRGAAVARLTSLDLRFPCTDDLLRDAITRNERAIADELADLYARHHVDVAVYVDALWGLGAVMPTDTPRARVLAVHVVGHHVDLAAALARHPHQVLTPSAVVNNQASHRGYPTAGWRVVPNALLVDPKRTPPQRRGWLRTHGPVRVLARAGAEKGVAQLLSAAGQIDRAVDVALAPAAFESGRGAQQWVLDRCRQYAGDVRSVTVHPGLPWADVAGWLADAALVIVPSLHETFGLVALEAMAGGTPVVAYDVDNLPILFADGGVTVPVAAGVNGLWRAAQQLLDDPVRYDRTSRAAYYRSRDYRPALVADQLLKAVS
jgi:glycosyltransferase involved in cell wall biosynthesis